MSESLFNEPVAIFLTIMSVVLVTPLLSELFHLPGIVGLILGGIIIGPHGLNFLAINDSIILLATVGLIYLMFSAGVEVNLPQFNRVRNKSLLFGLFTFLLPQLMGMLFGYWLRMDWLGALLLGSAFSSHTLIAFPVLSRLGIYKNEAVSITVGATVFTDIVAFIMLAVVISLHGGDFEPVYFLKLLSLLMAYAGLVLFGLPRLGKIFFRRFHNPSVEFQFVLVVLFISAVLAEEIGVHAVVGAFLAGLAINATLPHNSAVVRHVLFVGESFFIPVFLVYSGMMTDIGVFVQGWQTIIIGAGMTFVAYVSKFLAAAAVTRIFHYSKDEFFTVWGLSQAQAAVTIPTLVIGLQLGLFTETLFNAAIVMVLLTSITSPMIVKHYGQRLQPDHIKLEKSSLLDRILVPIANPETQAHLINLASILARTSKGILFPLHVAVEVQGRVQGLKHQENLLENEIFKDTDTNTVPIRRIDSSPAKGIVRAAIENRATLIVMGWRGKPTFRQSIFGTLLDEVIWHIDVPVLVGRMTTSINAIQRIVLVVPPNSLTRTLVVKTIDLVVIIAQATNVPLFILSAEQHQNTLEAYIGQQEVEHPYQIKRLDDNLIQDVVDSVTIHDLIVITTTGTPSRFRSSLGNIPEQLVAAVKGSMIIVHYP